MKLRHTLQITPTPPDSRVGTSCRKPRQWIVAVATVCWLSVVPVLQAEGRNGQPADGIAAHVNGEPITTEQLEETLQTQIEQMNRQLEQIRRSMLDRLINNLLTNPDRRVMR